MIKLKTLLEDTDQNNNGYPDSTEGNLGRTNVDTYYKKPPTGFQFTNKPIDSQANKLLMNYWDNILNSQEKQQEYQADRKAGDSNWRDGIESPLIDFQPNETYLFLQDGATNQNYQIMFSQIDGMMPYYYGNNSYSYVGTLGQPGAYTQITIPADFSGSLYYFLKSC